MRNRLKSAVSLILERDTTTGNILSALVSQPMASAPCGRTRWIDTNMESCTTAPLVACKRRRTGQLTTLMAGITSVQPMGLRLRCMRFRAKRNAKRQSNASRTRQFHSAAWLKRPTSGMPLPLDTPLRGITGPNAAVVILTPRRWRTAMSVHMTTLEDPILTANWWNSTHSGVRCSPFRQAEGLTTLESASARLASNPSLPPRPAPRGRKLARISKTEALRFGTAMCLPSSALAHEQS